MKTKSITDVITNSSSEVFILSTKKSLEQVKEELKGITSGYKEPDIIKEGDEYIEYLIDFNYFVDPDNLESVEYYYLDYIQSRGYFNWDTCEYIPTKSKYYDLWRNYVKENIDYIKESYFNKYKNNSDCYIVDRLEYDMDLDYWDLPKGFVKKFVDTYKLPEIPKDKLISSVIGKIGLFSIDDNSIPYETFEDINNRFDGENYHLG